LSKIKVRPFVSVWHVAVVRGKNMAKLVLGGGT